MILYVNGDSHTAAAEAVNPHAFAEDDPELYYLGRLPHPENLQVSWGKLLSLALNAGFQCEAESASSNVRILRTARAWLEERKNSLERKLVVIQWSTWEREEWLHDGIYYDTKVILPMLTGAKKLKRHMMKFGPSIKSWWLKIFRMCSSMATPILGQYRTEKIGDSVTLDHMIRPAHTMLSCKRPVFKQSCPIHIITDEMVIVGGSNIC